MTNEKNILRRKLLQGLGLATVAISTGLSTNLYAAEIDHSKMNHDIPIDPKLEELMDYVLECIKMAEICQQHALHMFQMGDTKLANCAVATQESLAVSKALLTLIANNSSHLKSYLKVVLSITEQCADECQKFAEDHIQCKDSAEACYDAVAFYKEFIGSCEKSGTHAH
jgi:Cys-rich four helix bundle protein (predicted Tat secretion target)